MHIKHQRSENHKTKKTTDCTREPLSTIQPDNVRSAVALQRRIMQSMTVTPRRRNICMSDSDKIPWNHSVAVAVTEYIAEPNNDSISWNKANPNAEERENVFIPDTDEPPWNNLTAVDATDWINGLSTNGISQNGADSTVNRTTEKNNKTAVKNADCNDETDNSNIFGGWTEDDNSIHTTTQKSDNDQESTITNATVPCHTTPPPPCQLDISNFTNQTTHRLHQQPCNADGTPMIHKPHSYACFKHPVASMITKSMDIYFVQETWLVGDAFDEVISGYHIFRHNGDKGNHNFCSVTIILSPQYYKGWKNAGARPPMTADAMGEFAGCYISINVTLKSYHRLGKQVRGMKGDKHLTLTLVSVYHPCTKTGSEAIYARFLDTLDTLLSKLPAHNEIIMGTDVNANIGRLDELQSSEFYSILGPYGFSKRNSKGKGLLTVYLSHCLQVMNTSFEGKVNGPGYGTWNSNQPTSTGQAESHMLDLIVCSATLHKRVQNCQVAIDGVDSNHCVVRMQLNLTLLKYNKKASLNGGEIDWRKICEEEGMRKLYNKYHLELTTRDITYDTFCEVVIRAGHKTAIFNNCKCKGWFKASETILIPAIEEKNRLRHRLQDKTLLNPTEITRLQQQLKSVNKQNCDLVDLAKARWYSGICNNIHNMRMDPR
jgi:exonuclease III